MLSILSKREYECTGGRLTITDQKGNCNLNIKGSRKCPSCRFKKCLAEGMDTKMIGMNTDKSDRKIIKSKIGKTKYEHTDSSKQPESLKRSLPQENIDTQQCTATIESSLKRIIFSPGPEKYRENQMVDDQPAESKRMLLKETDNSEIIKNSMSFDEQELLNVEDNDLDPIRILYARKSYWNIVKVKFSGYNFHKAFNHIPVIILNQLSILFKSARKYTSE